MSYWDFEIGPYMTEEWVNKVQSLLESKGYQQSYLAEKLEITEGATSRLLCGIGEPSFKQLETMGVALDVSVSEIIGDSAIIVSDKQLIKAVELMQDISEDKRETALKVLNAFIL